MEDKEDKSCKFICPECGGSWFGTNTKDETTNCHGEFYFCQFTFPNSDRWKYFAYIETKITTFKSKEEYEKHEKQEGE